MVKQAVHHVGQEAEAGIVKGCSRLWSSAKRTEINDCWSSVSKSELLKWEIANKVLSSAKM